MWLRRMDGGCLSYGAPAIPAHLHLRPAPFFRFCIGDVDEYMDIFLDTEATKEAVIQAGIAIFQYIYHGPDTTLGEICYMFSRKAVAGVIKPETLPPTKVAVAYTCRPGTGSFYRASLNPSDYGWTLGVHGYDPVLTLYTPWPLRIY